jgi:hypothetical protein
MTPRPIYRWKSFWLGVFVACFLAWAWGDSRRCETWLQVGGYGTVRLDGTTFVFKGVLDGSKVVVVKRGAKAATAAEEERFFVLRGVRHFKIRDSLVFFSFIALWGGWLAWRWRRRLRGVRRLEERSRDA